MTVAPRTAPIGPETRDWPGSSALSRPTRPSCCRPPAGSSSGPRPARVLAGHRGARAVLRRWAPVARARSGVRSPRARVGGSWPAPV